MSLFPKLSVTIPTVLIAPIRSPFPPTATIGLSVMCVLIVGIAVIGEFRRRR